MGLLYSDERLRRMYPGGRADPTARRLSHFWATAFRLGLLPRRWVTVEVAGRSSGRPVRFPLGMARSGDAWYLVSMLGENCNWVRNVRAAGGHAVLRRRSAVPCELIEVPAAQRPPILKRYVEQVPGGRPHIPVDRRAAVAAFEAIADRHPVFRVVPTDVPRRHRRWRWLAGAQVAVVALGSVVARGRPAPTTPPLALPAASASGPHASSVAGFGIAEEFFGISDGLVGRTNAVTGGAAVADDRVAVATFSVDLRSITVNSKTQPQFAQSLGVATNPDATFTLTGPLSFSPDLSSGARPTNAMLMDGLSVLVLVFGWRARRGGTVEPGV